VVAVLVDDGTRSSWCHLVQSPKAAAVIEDMSELNPRPKMIRSTSFSTCVDLMVKELMDEEREAEVQFDRVL
jgi:hypothetical protein